MLKTTAMYATDVSNGMYVRVQVTPGAKKECIAKKSDTEFVILVKEPKERNLANRRVRELLAREFAVEISCVHLLTGHRSQSKIFTIDM